MIAEVLELNSISQKIAANTPDEFPSGPGTREAAVAVILREHRARLQILFIQRATQEGDPWSGHMAFPGGHRDPTDASLQAVAQRETAEEIGLDLDGASYLGALDHQRAMPRGRPLNMLIAPHVFALEGDPTFSPNYEVSEVVWADLAPLVDGTSHDTKTYSLQGKPTIFNGYRLAGGHFVWGLTYRMLKGFFATIDDAWQPPQEL